MKCEPKTPSKNLGDLMKSGGKDSNHPKPYQHKNNEADSDGEIKVQIKEDLEQFDLTDFEKILQNVASSKTNLLKNVSSKFSPATISLMGLIDDAHGLLVTDNDDNTTTSTSIRKSPTPVEFDDVIDFIDDGVEEVIEKPPVVVAKKQQLNISSPVCGNPVTDFDKFNKMNGGNGENGRLAEDPVSLMEMGRGSDSQDKTFDDVNLEQLNKSQKNVRCDEQEQIDFLAQKGLHEFGKYNHILGPVSKGEFASFNKCAVPVVSCDLGVLNPITTANYNIFQTCTPNGHLLPAIPRKYFAPDVNAPHIQTPPPARKSPVTMIVRTPVQSLLATALSESSIPSTYFSTVQSKLLPSVKSGNEQVECTDQEQEKESVEADTTIESGLNSSSDDKGKKEKETTSEDEEKENGSHQTLSEKEQEAKRLKYKKDKEKKKAKKAEEKKRLEAEEKEKQEAASSLNSSRGNLDETGGRPSLGVGSTQQEDSSKTNQNGGNGRRSNGNGAGKNKKTEKGVSSEYTVGEPVATEGNTSEFTFGNRESQDTQRSDDGRLDRLLNELGISNVSELVENPGKKHKKGNNSKKNKQQQQQQKQSQKKTEKESSSTPADAEVNSSGDGADKNNKKGGKKMDEVAVAASITKRCSSGVGQQSEEDDDQSYVSAQENLGGSNSSISTPATEFVDARQSRDEVIDNDNVMLDPNNYRDDEDVESLALQLQKEEDEFITVGKNKKKNKKQASVQETASASSTASSSSPTTRRNTHPDARVLPAVGSGNASTSGNNQQQQSQHHQRSNNRPVAHSTTLGDFMESTKKDTHKNIKHKKTGGSSPSSSQKKQSSLDESVPISPAFHDAADTPISINTGSPSFSYADVAKKSSGENTPAHEMSPVPPAATNINSTVKSQPASPVPQSSSTERKKSQEVVSPNVSLPATKAFSTVVSGVQLPPSTASAADYDISFGYEETPEDKLRRQKKETKVATQPPASQKEAGVSTQSPKPLHKQPTRMNGIELLKSFTSSDSTGAKKDKDLQEMPKNGVNESNVVNAVIISNWKTDWDSYMNTGSKPIVFVPGKK